MLDILNNLYQNENGQGMVEYGLVLGVLAAGSMLFIVALRFSVVDLFDGILNKISDEINNLISV